MKKLLVIVILFLGVAFVILRFSEVQNVVVTLKSANSGYLVLALAIQLVSFAVLGLTFRSIYRLLGLNEGLWHLTLVAVAGGFVNIVAPSAGIGGIAMFVNDGQERQQAPGKVMVAGALYFLMDEAAFLCVLSVAMSILLKRHDLNAGEIFAAVALVIIALSIASLLYLGYRSSKMLGNVLAKMARLVNYIVRPFIRREYLSEARAHQFAAEVEEGLGSLPEKPRSLFVPFLFSLLNKILLMVILAVSFLSFKVPFTVSTIIGGFSIAYLFLIVSPTPSGVGVVEGIMAVALHSLRVNFSHAVIITLTYRAITFWAPLAIGALAFRLLNIANKKNKPDLQI
jgi:hypothetical protein